mgnify:FL=1
MKRLFTYYLLIVCCAFTAHAQYQLPNSGFEEWEDVSYKTYTGKEPVGWNSFLTGSGSLKGTAGRNQLEIMSESRPGSTGSKSAKLFARKVLGSIFAQGNLTTGCINMGSMSATDANGNYNYTEIGDGKQNQKFTGLPDAMRIWVKYNSTNTQYPYGKVSTILHTEGYYQDPMGNTPKITAQLVGTATKADITSQEDWQELTIPFVYEATTERPAYALVSFSSNTTPGQGTDGDYMMVDDLEYLYYSELASLSYNGTEIFDTEKTDYNIDAFYEEDKLAYTSNGKGATLTRSYNESTGLLTLTVKGDDWSSTNLNQHVYTLQFKPFTGEIASISYKGTPIEGFAQGTNHYYTVTGEYTEGCLTATPQDEGANVQYDYDAATRIATISIPESGKAICYYVKFAEEAEGYTSKLVISMNSAFLSAPVQEVGIADKKEGTVNLQLRNFSLEGLGLIGDIFVYDVAITADGNISKTDNITIFGEMGAQLEVLPLELTGKISQGNLSAQLSITWENSPITVDVYPLSTTSVDLTDIACEATQIEQVKQGLTNPNCIIYTDKGTTVAEGAENVVVGTSCAKLNLNKSNDISIPTAFAVTNASLTRSFAAGWHTICLPFATTPETLGAEQAQAFTAFDRNTLTFDKVTAMAANTPYLIYFAEEKENISVQNVNVVATKPQSVTFGNVTFVGNYEAGKNMEGLYGVAEKAGEQYIMRGGKGSTLGSTGAYFTVSGSEVNTLRIRLEGTGTGISDVEAGKGGQTFDIYSLNGIKVRSQATTTDGLPKGIYLRCGKKHIVK